MKNYQHVYFVFFGLLLSSNTAYSQNYLEYNFYLNQSKLLNKHEDSSSVYYLKTICYYDSAFNCVNNYGFSDDYKKATYFALKADNFDKAEDYSKGLIRRGYSLRKIKRKITKVNEDFKNSTQFSSLKDYYREHKKENKFKEDRKIKRKIHRIIICDQRYRFHKYNAVKQNKNDSVNVIKLKELFSDSAHYPCNTNLKEINLSLLQVPFLHLKPDDACFFANILLEMYLKGDYDNLDFVFEMLDQASYRYGTIYGYNNNGFFIKEEMPKICNDRGVNKQSFGFIKFSELDGNTWKQYIVPISDINYSDSVRTIFGFLSTEQSCLLNQNLIYDPDLFESKWGKFKLRDVLETPK